MNITVPLRIIAVAVPRHQLPAHQVHQEAPRRARLRGRHGLHAAVHRRALVGEPPAQPQGAAHPPASCCSCHGVTVALVPWLLDSSSRSTPAAAAAARPGPPRRAGAPGRGAEALAARRAGANSGAVGHASAPAAPPVAPPRASASQPARSTRRLEVAQLRDHRAGDLPAGTVRADRAGLRAVSGEEDARILPGCPGADADAARLLAQLERRQVPQFRTEPGGPEDRIRRPGRCRRRSGRRRARSR